MEGWQDCRIAFWRHRNQNDNTMPSKLQLQVVLIMDPMSRRQPGGMRFPNMGFKVAFQRPLSANCHHPLSHILVAVAKNRWAWHHQDHLAPLPLPNTFANVIKMARRPTKASLFPYLSSIGATQNPGPTQLDHRHLIWHSHSYFPYSHFACHAPPPHRLA